MKIEKKVNPLPVLTWNKLDFNVAKLETEADFPAISRMQEPELPEGVRFVESRDADGMKEWYASHGCSYQREAVVAGKYPMVAEQEFPTGMGSEADELFAEQGVQTRIYEISGKQGILRFDHTYRNGDAALESKLFYVKKNSEATLIECYRGEEGKAFVGSSTRVVLEQGAKLHLVQVQLLPFDYVYLEDCGAITDKEAQLEYTSLQLGSGKAFLGAWFDQKGYASQLYSNMGYIGRKDSFLDFNYVDTLRGKKTDGVMRFNGVLLDNAVKVSRETLDFRQYCTDASGDEEENILVLGKDSINKANPMILGEEEKVSGRHAVTVGRLSPEMLFYMQTRGISLAKAEELMVRSRIMEVANHVPDEELRKSAERFLDRFYCDREECSAPCV